MKLEHYYDFYENGDLLEECSVAFQTPDCASAKQLAMMAAQMEADLLLTENAIKANEVDDDDLEYFTVKDAAQAVREGISLYKRQIAAREKRIAKAEAILAEIERKTKND